MEVDNAVRAPATSFIVRVWKDRGSVPEMRGEIEHVASGEKRFFLDYWSLLNLIESWSEEMDAVR